MSDELLKTKLFIPQRRRSLVARPQLINRLNRGLQLGHQLTLISAPAGFGKTTLVGEWIDSCKRPFAWVSLDPEDGDLPRFLAYFVAALQTLAPAAGARTLEMLASPQPPAAETMLTALLNEIADIPDEGALVLDDYHVIEAQAVDRALAFMLDHLPPRFHLVITTREDPPLPLPRLRARGLLTDIRAADLRFTQEETAAFFSKRTTWDLSAAEIASLEKRTEGWVAGLQLAALSMQGHQDVHGFIAAFAGDDRYVVDYLVDEVLRRQPASIRRFLLQTSILNRLSGPLCDAVTGQEEGGALLETLERSNLFLIPLDDKRRWYRYHHLFADVLQVHLARDLPAELNELHRRASMWYARHDLTAEAVHHAFAADDFAHAAEVIELAWAKMDRNRQSPEWLRWVEKLPDDLVCVRPVLCAGRAWALLDAGDLEGAERWLHEAERSLAQTTRLAAAAKEELHHLPGSIASARTYLALALGDMADTQQYARQALSLLPPDAHLRRGTPAALLGLAHWAEGDLPKAQQAFAAAMASYEKAGNIVFVITGAYVLAEMAVVQGHLGEAADIYAEALALARAHGRPLLRGAADLYTGLSELALERNDLAAARVYLEQSQELGEEMLLPRWRFRWHLARAKLLAAGGNWEDALDALDAAEHHYIRGPVPDIRAIGAMRARIQVAQGRLGDAWQWATGQRLAIDDDLNYLREYDHLTLARLGIAQYRQDGQAQTLEQVAGLLTRLLEAAEAGGRTGSVLEILVLQALVHEAAADTSAALAPLARALTLAEAEGYHRLFTREGPALLPLLTLAADQGVTPAYVRQLLTGQAADSRHLTEAPDPLPAADPEPPPLVDSLSPRELEVLQLVAQGLSNREIAEQLHLAIATVKGHNRNIYSKLQVSRRTEAVARARALGLL